MRTACTRGPRAGVSLVEVIIVASLLVLMAASLVASSSDMSRVTSSGNVMARLQGERQDALRRVTQDLRRAGYVTLNGETYPITFEDGAFAPPHGHPVAPQEAEEGDPDFGIMRELLMVQPADIDRDGRPDMDGNLNGLPELDGNQDGIYSESPEDLVDWDPLQNPINADGVVWSHDEISYVVILNPDGSNYLERRVNGDAATAERIAQGVELLQFDLADGVEVPLGAARVRLFLRMHDPVGTLYRQAGEVTVRLRNGGGF